MITATIKPEDFEGKYENSSDCPIARAAKRALAVDSILVFPAGTIKAGKKIFRYDGRLDDKVLYIESLLEDNLMTKSDIQPIQFVITKHPQS